MMTTQMEAATLQTFIQNIDDFLFIEDRIVTCLWLCQTLKIHVNIAKQLLYRFLQEDGVKNKVSVTYILGGELKDGLGFQLKLVQEKDREEAKEHFSMLTTDHVYSVQKSARSLSPIDLYNAFPNFSINAEDRQLCSVKPPRDIEKREIKFKPVETKKPVTEPLPKATKPFEKNDSNKRESSSEAQGPHSKQKKISPEKNKGAKGAIANMFNRQMEKKKSDQSTKSENKVEKKKSAGLNGFLIKQPEIKPDNNDQPMEVDEDLPPIKETNNKIEVKERGIIQNTHEKPKKNCIQKSPVQEKKSKGKENRKKRKKRDENDDEFRKKRKRIATVFSSDSESSDNEQSGREEEPEVPVPTAPVEIDNEEEDIIPDTPGRKRVRKQIDKIYTDEDGFILTKKEYVYESCTDDEETGKIKEATKEISKCDEKTYTDDKISKLDERSSKTEDKKSSKGKKSPKKKQSPTTNKAHSKQSSIMSFLKKK